MSTSHSYACKDYPEMQACPFQVTAETEAELWKLMQLHATDAHGEDPADWSSEDRAFIKTLITSV